MKAKKSGMIKKWNCVSDSKYKWNERLRKRMDRVEGNEMETKKTEMIKGECGTVQNERNDIWNDGQEEREKESKTEMEINVYESSEMREKC